MSQPQGLPNLGQSCYLNTVLQALASLEPFTTYLNRLVVALYSDSSGAATNAKRDGFPRQLSRCLTRLRVRDVHMESAVYPLSLKEDVRGLRSRLNTHRGKRAGHNRQDDADDAFHAIMELLEDIAEGAFRGLKSVLRTGSSEEYSSVCSTPLPFEGLETNDMMCLTCQRNRPLRVHPFLSLRLRLVYTPGGGGLNGLLQEKYRPDPRGVSGVNCFPCTVVDARDSYQAALESGCEPDADVEEVLRGASVAGATPPVATEEDVDDWPAFVDKVYEQDGVDLEEVLSGRLARIPTAKRDIYRQDRIVQLPTLLCIHLDRASEGHGKRNEHVEIPFELAPSEVAGGKYVPFASRYALKAVAVHIGRDSASGHYVSFCLLNGAWYFFNDDAEPVMVSPGDVARQSAYMLFYEMHTSPPTPTPT